MFLIYEHWIETHVTFRIVVNISVTKMSMNNINKHWNIYLKTDKIKNSSVSKQ